MSFLAFQAQSQYVLTTQQLQGGGGTVRQTAAASHKHSASALSCRPHITLNPYSTQLVDNLNMMMPTTPAERAAAAAGSHSMTMQPKLLGLTNSLKGGAQQRQFQQQQDE